MKKCLAWLSAALCFCLWAAPAQAAEYYVATNGSASAAGTMAAPWTMAKAVGSTGAGPGDTVWIRGGTYNGAVNFTRSGNSGAWITFRAYQGELPIFAPSTLAARAARHCCWLEGLSPTHGVGNEDWISIQESRYFARGRRGFRGRLPDVTAREVRV